MRYEIKTIVGFRLSENKKKRLAKILRKKNITMTEFFNNCVDLALKYENKILKGV